MSEQLQKLNIDVYFFRSEYGAFWKCVQAAAMYIVMQLCKMLILATFFPPGDVSSIGGFDALGVSGHVVKVTAQAS